ncbi:MAG: hypothetical protein O3A19_04090 [Planctomycetota bacterium]|nr:hypothetical protein [Planctomycetota bacterium]
MEESGCSNHDEEAWSAIITKVVIGQEDDETAWAFRFAVEQRVWAVVLSGPQNDPAAARVKGPFRNLFRDPHAAEDFIAEFTDQIDRSRAKGRYRDESFLELSQKDALSKIAAKSLIRKRAISSVRKFSRGGITGLPDHAGNPVSYDAGDAGGWGDQIKSPTGSAEPIPDSGLGLLRRLLNGEAILELSIKHDRLDSVEETAALQTWVLLDPSQSVFESIRLMIEGRIVGGIDALLKAHVVGRGEIDAALADCVSEFEAHPAMELKRLDGIDRRRTRLEGRRLFDPLSASSIRELLDLPSLNAGEKRNSKYRAGISGLFPQFDDILHDLGVLDRSAETST